MDKSLKINVFQSNDIKWIAYWANGNQAKFDYEKCLWVQGETADEAIGKLFQVMVTKKLFNVEIEDISIPRIKLAKYKSFGDVKSSKDVSEWEE